MSIKVDGGYLCGYCKKIYKQYMDAEGCKDSHNLIYIPISHEDLGRLLQFIFTKEDALLPEGLVERLQKFLKGGFNLIKASKNG
jgi:hypothetical protein